MPDAELQPANTPSSDDSLPEFDQDLRQIGEDLLGRLPIGDITLLPLSNKMEPSAIRAIYPQGPVVACDFKVEGIEQGSPVTGGYERDEIVNIDHHAEMPEMYRFISSGNLAIEWVVKNGPLAADVPLVVNHTDCDSVISSLIMRGHLPPHREFGRAVLAADHAGDRHPIADLLQALDPKRDLNFSARNLALFLKGEELEPDAQRLLAYRDDARKRAQECVTNGNAQLLGPLVFIRPDRKVEGEFFPALFPQAVVILSVSPLGTPGPDGQRWEVKLRLGKAAPEGFNLFSLGINDNLDPIWGGRWNAGSNKRGGGTLLPPEEYAAKLQKLIEERLP